MSNLFVDNLAGRANPTYVNLPTGVVDNIYLGFQTINGASRITIKEGSLTGNLFSGDFIPNGSITSIKLANGAVGTAQLALQSVTTPILADHAVTQIKLAFGAVTNTELAPATILSANIANGAVVTQNIANSSITSALIANGAVQTVHYSPLSINTSAYADGSVTLVKLGNDVISSIQTASGLPSGSIQPSASVSIPNGWLPCDGSEVSRTSYATLYAAIGSNYGPGDGSTTFDLPDARGRVLIGYGAGLNLTNRAIGAFGGEETHLLSVNEIPTHLHVLADNGHVHIPNEGAGHGHPISQNKHSHIITQTAPHAHGITDKVHTHSLSNFHLQAGSFTSGSQINFINTNAGSSQTTTPSGTGITTTDPAFVPGFTCEPQNADVNVVTMKTGMTIGKGFTGLSMNTVGGSAAHNNMQPWLAVNYIIKA